MRKISIALIALVLLVGAFSVWRRGKGTEKPKALVYQAVPVERRDIVVSARATGVVQPDTVVEVKSKASGEILEMRVETGQVVPAGTLMVRIDQRIPKNELEQAESGLEVAKARLANAEAQRHRADELFKSQSISEQEHETAVLAVANAKADVINAQVAVENAKIAMDDTNILAPITGTVISKSVERGQVISSPTKDVGGGTALLKMADLNLVQVQTQVDETDIGKVRPGMRATVTVDAYPNQPFEGEVLKIEPMAQVQQNVTMFTVQVRIENRGGLLRPGMNADVEVHIGRRDSVLAVPNAALRTQRDVSSAAQVLGVSPDQLQRGLAAAQKVVDSARALVAKDAPKDSAAAKQKAKGDGPGGKPEAKPAGNVMTTPDGRQIPLPSGVTEQQVRAIFAKFRSGEQPTPAERQILMQLRQSSGGGGGGGTRSRGQNNNFQFGGNYIVFVLRDGLPTPVMIRTGLTDLDYSEVVNGLTPKDSVLVLPSASLVQQQQEFKNRITNMTGGGAPAGMRQQTQTAPTTRVRTP